ncbi:ACT domain-containing protein [Artemisia annua]|uniref:ACT domain-containing protein ACR n=1 Tax=Artemisia annua TaxID=35608 RepID=A0A2U1KI08_ARTAN|nr:ACT domain-containing protein [Artemisia annua]
MSGLKHRQRRSQQIMFAERDYEKIERAEQEDRLRPQVTVLDFVEKDNMVITMHCRDRPKLLFDIICTLTDMDYVVFHGVVHTGKMEAFQCLEAAIERRTSEDGGFSGPGDWP